MWKFYIDLRLMRNRGSVTVGEDSMSVNRRPGEVLDCRKDKGEWEDVG